MVWVGSPEFVPNYDFLTVVIIPPFVVGFPVGVREALRCEKALTLAGVPVENDEVGEPRAGSDGYPFVLFDGAMISQHRAIVVLPNVKQRGAIVDTVLDIQQVGATSLFLEFF